MYEEDFPLSASDIRPCGHILFYDPAGETSHPTSGQTEIKMHHTQHALVYKQPLRSLDNGISVLRATRGQLIIYQVCIWVAPSSRDTFAILAV